MSGIQACVRKLNHAVASRFFCWGALFYTCVSRVRLIEGVLDPWMVINIYDILTENSGSFEDKRSLQIVTWTYRMLLCSSVSNPLTWIKDFIRIKFRNFSSGPLNHNIPSVNLPSTCVDGRLHLLYGHTRYMSVCEKGTFMFHRDCVVRR